MPRASSSWAAWRCRVQRGVIVLVVSRGRQVRPIVMVSPATGGVIAADICKFSEAAMRLPAAFARLARTFSPGITQQRLDAQVYWAYEFPTPA
jgi:hypothetical protein